MGRMGHRALAQAHHFAAYAVAHGHHGHIGAQGKEPHPHNQEDGPQQEHHQGSHGHIGGQGKA